MKPEIQIFGDRPSRYSIDALTVKQQEGMHDLCTAYLARPGEMDGVKGAPCTITWNNSIAAQTAYGYVDTTSNIGSGGPVTGMLIMALGASSVMRNGTARTWRRTPPRIIARNIVTPYRMGIVTDKYISAIDAFMQSADSDWAALVRLAGITGMSLVTTGTTVRLVDVRKAIGRSLLRPIPNLVEPDSFVQLETPAPVGYDAYAFTGIDALGSTFTVSGGVPGGIKRHSGQNFSSLEEARLAQHRQQDRERHYVKAVAEFAGQLSVKLGDVVQVEGNRWYVASCEHDIKQGTDESKVTLELHRSASERPTSSDFPIIPASTIRNGKWVAERSYEVEL